MAFDLNDAWGWIQKLISRVSRLESGAMLENSSITNGRMRFIGGLLRVDSGGRVEIEGTLEGGGTFVWTGTLTNNGTLVQNGTWELNGVGEIVGNTLLTGNLTVQGGGKITLGNMVLDPSSNGGSVKFAGGPEIYASGAMLGLYSVGSGGWIELDGNGARLYHGTRSVRVTSSGIQMTGLPTRTSANANGAVVGTVWSDTSGNLYRVVL